MDSAAAIASLGALAHEHRLAVFRLLVEAGPGGLPAGAVAEAVGLAPSSLTFHLQQLERAGLVARRRSGRRLICAVDFAAMTGLVAYLTENCCAQAGAGCAAACEPAAAPSRPLKKTRRIA